MAKKKTTKKAAAEPAAPETTELEKGGLEEATPEISPEDQERLDELRQSETYDLLVAVDEIVAPIGDVETLTLLDQVFGRIFRRLARTRTMNELQALTNLKQKLSLARNAWMEGLDPEDEEYAAAQEGTQGFEEGIEMYQEALQKRIAELADLISEEMQPQPEGEGSDAE